MSYPPKILFDLDQVAADWEGRMMGVYAPTNTLHELNRHPERHRVIRGIYEQDLDFFLRLDSIPEFFPLMEAVLEHVDPKDIGWLTAIGDVHPNPRIVRQHKHQWIREHIDNVFGTDTHKRACVVNMSAHKARIMADKRPRILIDDFYRNCVEWENVGGKAIHHTRTMPIEPVVDTIKQFITYHK